MTNELDGNLTHSRVLKIALPIMISNATVPILGAVDTGVVGQMGEAAPIGAVGIGAIVLTAIYWIFGFLRMGIVGLASQAHGAGQKAEVSALLSRALMIGVAGGVLIVALQTPLFSGAFWVSPASSEVETLARDYMVIRVWSAPAAIAIFGITGWLIALERARAVLVLQIWMNGVNITLDLWFVLGLDWGVEGVAIATFLAEWSGLALGLWLCRSAFLTPAWRDWVRIFDRAILWRMAAVNRDILLRSLFLEGIFVSFLFIGARFGDVTLAANQILTQFLHITAYALDGFAFGAEALVGQAVGARNRGLIRRSAFLASFWGLICVIVMAGIFALFGGALIDLMAGGYSFEQQEAFPWVSATLTENGAIVRDEASNYLLYMVLAPLIGVAAWMLDGIFIGATRSADMRNMMAISFAIYLLAAFALVPMLGNHGLWIALLVSFVARGITLGLRYPALEAQHA